MVISSRRSTTEDRSQPVTLTMRYGETGYYFVVKYDKYPLVIYYRFTNDTLISSWYVDFSSFTFTPDSFWRPIFQEMKDEFETLMEQELLGE